MGYPAKLQKLCALRGIDQTALAARVGVSKSSISRVLSGIQEPKFQLMYHLARELGVSLDYLVDESAEIDPSLHLVGLTEGEMTVLRIVRRLGVDAAIDRLVGIGERSPEDSTASEG